MMIVRKGRTLLRRAMVQLDVTQNEVVAATAFQVWREILVSVPLTLKKDREETENQLSSFGYALKRHMEHADMKHLLTVLHGLEQKAAILLAIRVGNEFAS